MAALAQSDGQIESSGFAGGAASVARLSQWSATDLRSARPALGTVVAGRGVAVPTGGVRPPAGIGARRVWARQYARRAGAYGALGGAAKPGIPPRTAAPRAAPAR